MTMIAGPVTVDAARLAYLERVERAAAHEVLAHEAVARHRSARPWDDRWVRQEVAVLAAHRAALAALRATVAGGAARPAGEGPNGV